MRMAGALFVVFLTLGCGAPTVDTSSDESLKTSLEEVRDSLPEDQRDEFDQALQELAFADISLEDMVAQSQAEGVDLARSRIKSRLANKTAEEILAEAETIRQERELRQREQALQEIAELERKKRSAEEAKEALSRFRVERSRLRRVPQRYGRPEPVIELSFTNDTNHAVSRAYFEGILASPGRSVPWIKDTFNYSIPGGLEPGESASWNLAPNRFSDWGTVDYPADAILTVTVVKLDGVDEETLYDAEGLSEFEEERLDELRDEYAPK